MLLVICAREAPWQRIATVLMGPEPLFEARLSARLFGTDLAVRASNQQGTNPADPILHTRATQAAEGVAAAAGASPAVLAGATFLRLGAIIMII